MPPKGKASSKAASSKGKGADGDAESSSGGKQAKGGTAVKVFYTHNMITCINSNCVSFVLPGSTLLFFKTPLKMKLDDQT